MKTFRFSRMYAMATFALFAMTSCSSSSDDIGTDEKPAETKTYQVKIGFTGEITNITESPLSRADGAKDWYIFQVYSSPENEDNYTYYAYGLFDSKDNMVINLKGGYKYRFDVDMIVDASEKVKNSIGLWPSITYVSIGNNFVLSNKYIASHYSGYLYYLTEKGFSRPNVDRFFGITTDYVPKVDGTVSINMKRVAFGVKFVAKDFKEGSLQISMERAPTINWAVADGNEYQEMISFYYLAAEPGSSVKYAYENDSYTESIPTNIVWIKADGTNVPIASKTIDFKRNKLTTIEFTVGESSTSSSIDLNSDEEMEAGDTVTL